MSVSPADVAEAPDDSADGPDGPDSPEGPGASSSPTTSTWKEMLFSTEPSEDLGQVESPWNPDRGGITRVYRGIKKMLNVNGIPAIADVAIGVAEWVTGMDLEGDAQEGESDDESAEGLPEQFGGGGGV